MQGRQGKEQPWSDRHLVKLKERAQAELEDSENNELSAGRACRLRNRKTLTTPLAIGLQLCTAVSAVRALSVQIPLPVVSASATSRT